MRVLLTGATGFLGMEVLARLVDRVDLVSEAHIEQAIVMLLEIEKSVVEGAGAAGDRVRLLPANKQYKPIPFGPDGRILGKVVTVLRRV